MRRLGPLYGGAVALVGSTPLRWPGVHAGGASVERRAPVWIVAVGALIGLVAYAVAIVLDVALPAPLAALLGLAVLTFASAAILERGVVERIDRDAHGAASPSVTAILALVFGALVRGAAIVLVAPDRWLGAFITAALVGRWAAVFLQSIGDPIIDDDAPRSLVVTRAPAWLIAALSAVVLVGAAVALGKAGVIAMAIAAVLAFAVGVDAQRRDGHLSAPVVATAAAIGELVVLLASAA